MTFYRNLYWCCDVLGIIDRLKSIIGIIDFDMLIGYSLPLATNSPFLLSFFYILHVEIENVTENLALHEVRVPLLCGCNKVTCLCKNQVFGRGWEVMEGRFKILKVMNWRLIGKSWINEKKKLFSYEKFIS